jgi:hypothetical protein
VGRRCKGRKGEGLQYPGMKRRYGNPKEVRGVVVGGTNHSLQRRKYSKQY